MKQYEIVMGLEVHAELSTKTKIFCGCSTKFGAEPNTQICPVCAGMPGTLPVLNKEVVNKALKAGLALHCHINRLNTFDKKNYFYPDLPNAYQVTQLFAPICQNGYLEIETAAGKKKIGIHQIHMEEDAGKLVHDPWEDCTLIDYNRCGVPLIEIVSNPDFRSAEEVIAYLESLRELLIYLDISDCKLEEGSMRADINISVREAGQEAFGVRTEIKNMNSFKAIQKAIAYESQRHIEMLTEGKKIIQETRRWDDNKDKSFSMRSKENAEDYKYFPNSDLLPVEISDEWLSYTKETLPETAASKRERFIKDFGIPPYDAAVITSEKPLCDLFEKTNMLCSQPKEVSNQIIGEIMRLMKDTNTKAENMKVAPEKLSDLIMLILKGEINRTAGKEVLEQIFINDIEPLAYIESKGLAIVDDSNLIETTVKEVMQENPKSIADFKAGKEKAFGFLVGQTMKKLKGKGNPEKINKAINKYLNIV